MDIVAVVFSAGKSKRIAATHPVRLDDFQLFFLQLVCMGKRALIGVGALIFVVVRDEVPLVVDRALRGWPVGSWCRCRRPLFGREGKPGPLWGSLWSCIPAGPEWDSALAWTGRHVFCGSGHVMCGERGRGCGSERMHRDLGLGLVAQSGACRFHPREARVELLE